jgi:hypothetical protein
LPKPAQTYRRGLCSWPIVPILLESVSMLMHLQDPPHPVSMPALARAVESRVFGVFGGCQIASHDALQVTYEAHSPRSCTHLCCNRQSEERCLRSYEASMHYSARPDRTAVPRHRASCHRLLKKQIIGGCSHLVFFYSTPKKFRVSLKNWGHFFSIEIK